MIGEIDRWAIGVLDSEGNLELNLTTWNTKKGKKANVRASIRVGMSDENSILYLQECFGAGTIYKSKYKNKRGLQDFYTLILNEKETYDLLPLIDGKLITKKNDISIMKMFFAGKKRESFEMMKKIKRGTKHDEKTLGLIS